MSENNDIHRPFEIDHQVGNVDYVIVISKPGVKLTNEQVNILEIFDCHTLEAKNSIF